MLKNCEITTGRGLSCSDSIGGIQKLFFINFGTAKITLNPTDDSISAIAAIGGGDVNIYEYILKGTGNNLTQNGQSDSNTGTTFVEQTVNATLKKMTSKTNKEVKLMAYGNPQIIVYDNQGKAWLVGREHGADLTTFTATTGDAYGDLNGYVLALIANERTYANFITGSNNVDGDPFSDPAMQVNVIGGSEAEYTINTGVAHGTFMEEAPVTPAEFIELTINEVTEIGTWNITSSQADGIEFKGSGTFVAKSATPQTVKLPALGTPDAGSAGTVSVTVIGDDSGGEGSATVSVTIAPKP